MTLQQLENVNFGHSHAYATGSTGVGYTLYDQTGSIQQARTTGGVYEVVAGKGLYAAYVSLPDDWRGQIVWDTGTAFLTASYAIEQLNVEEHNPLVTDNHTMITQMSGTVSQIAATMTLVSGTVGQLYDIQYGRWKIDNNKMRFYKEDNATVIAEFDLFDDAGTPSMDAVFDRRRI